MADKRFGIGLGIGFWTGMAAMSLINFCGSIIFDRNYYTLRYSFFMFFISAIFAVIGLIYLKHYKSKNKS